MDTMEWTKIVGGVCGTFLIFLLVKTGAEAVIHPPAHHGDDHHNAYVIEVEESGEVEEEVEVAAVEISPMMAAAEATAGEALYKRACASCHKLEPGANAVGPYLAGIIDRPIGGAEGFNYSDGFAETGENWDIQSLSEFLTAPKKWAPKTKMSYKGMAKPEDRANLIMYLQSAGG